MATQPQSVIPMAVRPMETFTPEALPPELAEKLKAPLPEKAIGKHPHLKGFSSINPAFVIERMNDVFGIGGYQETYREISVTSKQEEWKEKDDKGNYTGKTRMVTLIVAAVHGTLKIPRYGIYLENFGGSKNEDPGDALKGACTDAFTKMTSHLGIGLDVYKSGKHDSGEELPPCPGCKKTGTIIKGKAEYGGGYVCFTKKNGCGAKFTDAEMEQIKSGKTEPQPKPAQSAQQPRQTQKKQPIADNVEKKTISAIVTEKRVEDRKAQNLDSILWLQVGNYRCASKTPDIWKALNPVKVGSKVTLLVSKLSGQASEIYLIHKVIPNVPDMEVRQ